MLKRLVNGVCSHCRLNDELPYPHFEHLSFATLDALAAGFKVPGGSFVQILLPNVLGDIFQADSNFDTLLGLPERSDVKVNIVALFKGTDNSDIHKLRVRSKEYCAPDEPR